MSVCLSVCVCVCTRNRNPHRSMDLDQTWQAGPGGPGTRLPPYWGPARPCTPALRAKIERPEPVEAQGFEIRTCL